MRRRYPRRRGRFDFDPVASMFFQVWIPGRPIPQGSKAAFMPRDPRNPKRNHPTARPIMRESSKGLKPWRKFVTRTARAETPPGWTPIDVDVNLSAEFVFERPALHFGTGRNVGVVKERFVSTMPTSGSQGDLSKLVRAVEDSLTDAGVWTDDRLVVSYDGTRKRYARDGESSGVLVRIEPATS